MAHIEKATRLQVQGLLRHDTRTNESYSNECIDLERTKDNYNLVGDPFENYEKRMNEVYCLNRKDVNTLVEIVITKPTDVSDQEQRAFFEECLENTKRYFGEKNVISAAVHLDETTPHIHLKAIPVYYNEKKQREQVSFDKVCPRDFYQHFHEKLSKDIKNRLGHDTQILNGATVENKTVKQLKAEHSNYLKSEIEKQRKQFISDREKEKKYLSNNLEQLKSSVKPSINVLGKKYIDYDTYLQAKANERTLAQKNFKYETNKIDFETLKEQVWSSNYELQEKLTNSESNVKYLQKENKKMKNKNLIVQERDSLKQENQELKNNNNKLINQNNSLSEEIKNTNDKYVNFDYYKGFYDTTTKSLAKIYNKDKDFAFNIIDNLKLGGWKDFITDVTTIASRLISKVLEIGSRER